MDVQSAYRQEQDRLDETLGEVDRQLAVIGPRYFGDDFVEQVLDAKREETRERLALLAKEPYFGRLDFEERAPGRKPVPLYIGKRGMDRPASSEPYIVDWRAPVASLFYSFTGGEDAVEYDSPDGPVRGNVHLKRNLAIRERSLQRVVDSYVRGGDNLAVSDEFLLYRLGETKDNRLRDIVSTIQAEQDRIIRAPRPLALIIQGAAGSGKTTVALHRLAYLLYQYQEQIRAEKMIIFAPNAMFLDYISGVLPELGVGSIQQSTFADWAMELLEGAVKLADEGEALERRFALAPKRPTEDDFAPERYKGSLAYRDWIDGMLDRFERTMLPEADFVPWEGHRLPAETIFEWFEVEYRHFPLAQRWDRLSARMKRWLEIALKEQNPGFRGMVERTAKQKLAAYLKKMAKPAPAAFYKLLYGLPKAPDWLDPAAAGAPPEPVAEATRRGLRKNIVRAEDLPALLWIRRRLYGADGHEFDHVVVDEAQDVPPFQIALLNGHMREPSFTILGDLAQGIHEYKGVRRWEELAEVFPTERVSRHMLVQSYRSTTEIIEFSARIAAHAGTGLPSAQPVFRSGEPVAVSKLNGRAELVPFIAGFVAESLRDGMHTVAIIGRTGDACRTLHRELAEAGTEASLLEEGQRDYRGGLSVVPAYLAKGLEFDAVLVVDADAEHYRPVPQDAKLLYVACTRALHRLTLAHAGAPTPLIAEDPSRTPA